MEEQIYQHVYKLWLFSLVAELKNFKLVAMKVGVTPSAISQNITALEAFMEKTLLIRTKGTVEVTEAGQSLLESVNPLLERLSAVKESKDTLVPIRSRVKFGAYESIALTIAPLLMQQLREYNRDIRLDIMTGRSSQLATLVRQGSLDFAFVTEGIREAGMEIDTIGDDSLGLFMAKHFAPERGRQLLDELGVGTFSAGPDGYPLYYQKFLASLPQRVELRMTTDSVETIRSMTVAGKVVGILPRSMAERGDDLQEIQIAGSPLHEGRHRWLLVSRKNLPTQLKDLMLTHVRSCFEKMTGNTSPET